MANYTVAAGKVAAHDKTLTASTVDTVTFAGADLSSVQIVTSGSAAIYVAFGAEVPTVSGSNTYKVPAVAGSYTLPVHTSGDTVVSLISTGTPVYSVVKAG